MQVVAAKGSKNVQVQWSGDRERISVNVCFNQSGDWLLQFILKGSSHTAVKARKNAFIATKKWEPRVFVSFTDNATQTEVSWRDFMIDCVLKQPENILAKQSVFVVDGHISHGEATSVLALSDAGHDLITIPAHASHIFNGFDTTLAKSLKAGLLKLLAAKRLGDPANRVAGGDITHDVIIESVCIAMARVMADGKVASNAFRKTGIFPRDRTVVPDFFKAPGNAFSKCCADLTLLAVAEGAGGALTGVEKASAVAAQLPPVQDDVMRCAIAHHAARKRKEAAVRGASRLTDRSGLPSTHLSRIAQREQAAQHADAERTALKAARAAAREAKQALAAQKKDAMVHKRAAKAAAVEAKSVVPATGTSKASKRIERPRAVSDDERDRACAVRGSKRARVMRTSE